MSDNLTIFAEDLQKNLLEKGIETKLIKSLSDLCNCFGNHDDEIAKVVVQNDISKRNFLILASICGIYMGYTGKCESWQGQKHWDDRNKASIEYCQSNYDTFLSIFERTSGMSIKFCNEAKHQYFFDDCLIGKHEMIDTPVVNEVVKFAKDHPTLQQQMMGVFTRMIGNNKLAKGIEPTGFPFI